MLKQGGLFAPISREGALVVNNLFLTTACASVLVGTLYPLALEQITGAKITVGAPFFNMSAGTLLLAVTFLTPFGFSLAWKRGDLLGVAQRLSVALLGGFVTLAILLATLNGGPVLAPIAAALAVFVMLGSVAEIVSRAFRGGAGVGSALHRARGWPLSFWGGALAHFGVGVTLLGLAATGFGAETIVAMRPDQPVEVGPYRVVYERLEAHAGPNYQEVAALMKVSRDGAEVTTLAPARRNFGARQMATTQAGIATLHFGQLYISIADVASDGSLPVRMYWKPLVTLIWLGALAMAFGGALSLADRRLRIGAPVPARSGAKAASA
jgi:cytochrome c-type biogenesis protein CcmF